MRTEMTFWRTAFDGGKRPSSCYNRAVLGEALYAAATASRERGRTMAAVLRGKDWAVVPPSELPARNHYRIRTAGETAVIAIVRVEDADIDLDTAAWAAAREASWAAASDAVRAAACTAVNAAVNAATRDIARDAGWDAVSITADAAASDAAWAVVSADIWAAASAAISDGARAARAAIDAARAALRAKGGGE